MAVGFDRVNTRKLAMAARFGYAPSEVVDGEFTDEHIGVLAGAFAREKAPSGIFTAESGSVFVRVYWDNPDLSAEARQAIDQDWSETLTREGIIL